MNDSITPVGIDRIIRLDWLEKTANLVMARNDKDTINNVLQTLLEEHLSGGVPGVRGAREKTITNLMKIWLNVPIKLKGLRDEGLSLLQSLPRHEQIVIHWGMIMASYPFWGSVAANTGRLLRLQGTAVAAHVQRRVKEQYGERETVSRAAQRVIRSFINWNVLNETDKLGIYNQGVQYSITNTSVIAWLLEAILHSHTNEFVSVSDLSRNPSIFPFHLAHVSAQKMIELDPRLDSVRHGFDEYLLTLR